MSGQTIGTIVGSAFGPVGALIGGYIGSMFDPAVQVGPRLSDLKAQSSEYGRPIPITYGTVALAGNVIWAADLTEVERDLSGKGGPEQFMYVYYANFAVAICEGPVSLGRIWAGPDKRLIWDGGTLEGAEEGAELFFYPGDEEQMPDPLMESYLGAGNVPPHRGTAYVVFKNFPVQKDGNRIPFLTIEVGARTEAPQALGYVWPRAAFYGNDKLVVSYTPGHGGHIVQGTDEDHTAYSGVFLNVGTTTGENLIAYDPDRAQTIYFSGTNSRFVIIPDATGVEEYHYVDRSAFPANGSVFSGSLAYYQGKYLFGFFSTALLKPVIAVVDPDSLETEAVYSYPVHTWNMLAQMLTPATGDYVVGRGLGGGEIIKYPLSASSPVSLGFAPHNPTFGSLWGIDKATGYVYVVGLELIGWTNTFTYSVHDSVGEAEILQTTVELANDFRPHFWFFCPHDIDGTPRMICVGTRYFGGAYSDHYLIFGANGVFFAERNGASIFPNISGRTGIYAMAYDSDREVMIALRDSYGGAIVAESGVEGGPETIPVQSWVLGASTGTADPQSANLADIVTDLSVRAGLTEGQIDVTDLEEDTVDGYLLASQMDVRAAVLPLMSCWFFDPVESQGKVKFVKRGGDIAWEIEDDDLGAYESGGQSVDPLETVRQMPDELPANLNVRYILEATNYDGASRLAKRLVGNSGNEATIDFPIVMTETKAQEVAEVNLHLPWIERLKYRFSLPRKYAELEPTDPVAVKGYRMRLVTVKQTGGRYQCEAVHDDARSYFPNVIVTETVPPPPQVVETISATTLELLDINMIRDADNDSGIWVAVRPTTTTATWNGAALFESLDGGATYARIADIPTSTVMGTTTTALGNFLSGNIVDELNSVNVVIPLGTLSSTTLLGILNGTNAGLIGNEIVCFRDATLEDDGSYTLRGLLRGCRGTEGEMANHAEGERFVLLSTATMVRVARDTSTIGSERMYKAVSVGGSLANTQAVTFTNTAAGLEPYSPVHLGGGRNAANDVTINAIRRNRIDGSWRNNVDVPMSETPEAYEVDVYADDTYATVLRTISGLSSPTASYTAAQQVSDGLTPGDPVYVRMYQMSAVVGRGYAATGTV